MTFYLRCFLKKSFYVLIVLSDFSLLGTSSIDTTCTIWGLETGQVIGRVNMVTGQVKTQLIAHDKEVYDIAFSKGKILPFNGFEKDLLFHLYLNISIL